MDRWKAMAPDPQRTGAPFPVPTRYLTPELEDSLGLAPSAPRGVLTVVIPMYNEAARIGATVAALRRSSLHRPGIDFVFVDDGSTDATVAVATIALGVAGLRARVVQLATNVGKGGAVKAGVELATGDAVGYIDADLSLDPAVVSQALAVLTTTGADLVVGRRIVDPTAQPTIQRLGSAVFRKLAKILVPTGTRDTQCAMKIFRSQVAATLFGELRTDGFSFDVEILRRAATHGYRVEGVLVAWQHQPGSKRNTLTDSARMLRQLFAIRAAVRSESPENT